MNAISYKNPEFFYLLLLLLPITAWYIWKQKKLGASIQFSSTMGFS
jgi:Ca-activated chloride channel family protein